MTTVAKGGNEVEIVVTSKDNTKAGLKGVEESFEGLGGTSSRLSGRLGDVGERADRSEQRILGLKDAVDGAATVMRGPGEQGVAAYIQGWADLASGLANFVFPVLQSVAGSLLSNAAAMAKNVGATIAQSAASTAMAVKTAVVRGATMAWTAAQWLLNAALSANPVGLVIIAIAALIAIIVIAYNRSATFRNIVQGAFRSVLAAGRAMISGLRAAFSFFSTIGSRIRSAFSGAASWLYNAGKAIVQGLINGVKGSIGAAIQTVRDMASSAINAAKGVLGISSPSKVFRVIGEQIGDGLTGGIDSKRRQAAGAGAALAGATVAGVGVARPQGGPATASGVTVIQLHMDGKQMAEVLLDPFRKAVRTRGGNVQAVLGR